MNWSSGILRPVFPAFVVLLTAVACESPEDRAFSSVGSGTPKGIYTTTQDDSTPRDRFSVEESIAVIYNQPGFAGKTVTVRVVTLGSEDPVFEKSDYIPSDWSSVSIPLGSDYRPGSYQLTLAHGGKIQGRCQFSVTE